MKKLAVILALLGLTVYSSMSFAEDAAAPAMDPEMAAKMAAMEKYGAPGENHKRLESIIGIWNSTVTSRMSSEAPAETMKGTSENRWILDGRFVQQDFKGDFHGKPFSGIGITGYDNVRGEYSSVWIDNISTGMMTSAGQFDEAQNAINESGTFSCPLTGEKDMTFRSVWKIADNGHHSYEMYTKDKTGNEFKMMEITYERVA